MPESSTYLCIVQISAFAILSVKLLLIKSKNCARRNVYHDNHIHIIIHLFVCKKNKINKKICMAITALLILM